MGKLIYLVMFTASLDPNYREASETSRRALLETPMMREELKKLEDDTDRKLNDWTGLTKDDLVYAGYAYPVIAGKISTKPFKNFKYETQNHWTLRPEFEYGVWSKETTVYLGLIKEF